MSSAVRTLTSTYLRLTAAWSLPILGMLIAGPWLIVWMLRFQSGTTELDMPDVDDILNNAGQMRYFNNFVAIMLVAGGAIAWGRLPEIVWKAQIRLLPVPTQTLGTILWLVPACILMLCNVVVQHAYAWMFQTQWPILTTTLCFGAFGMLLMAITFWMRDFRFYKVPLVICGVIGWGYWFAQHFHPHGFRQPAVSWDTLSVGDSAFLLATVAGSWFLTVSAFAKYRCGEAELGNLLKLLYQPPHAVFLERSRNTVALPKSKSAFKGLLAMEWAKGRTIAISTATGLSLFSCLMLMGVLHDHRNPGKAVTIVFPMMAVLCGMMSGPWLGMDVSSEMRQYYSTLPFTDADLSRAFVKICQRCTLLSSLILIGTAFVFAGCYALFVEPLSITTLLSVKPTHGNFGDPGIAGGILLIITSPIVGWVTCGITAAITATGRQWVQVMPATVAVVFLLLVITLPIFFGSWGETAAGVLAVIVVPGVGILGTAWLFELARRKNLIRISDSLICVAIAVGLMLAICMVVPIGMTWKLIWCSAACLVVTPVAALPVALSWNRHR